MRQDVNRVQINSTYLQLMPTNETAHNGDGGTIFEHISEAILVGSLIRITTAQYVVLVSAHLIFKG